MTYSFIGIYIQSYINIISPFVDNEVQTLVHSAASL
jgi:hypothetical protein